jgi:hypothetical protein
LETSSSPSIFIGPVSNTVKVDVARIRAILDGDTRDIRDACRALIDREPIFRDTPDAPDEQLQEMTYLQTKKIASQHIVPLTALKDDPSKFYALFEAMSFFSYVIESQTSATDYSSLPTFPQLQHCDQGSCAMVIIWWSLVVLGHGATQKVYSGH